MKKNKQILLILLLILAASNSLITNVLANEERVVVIGKSVLKNLTLEKARERALEDAFRTAVEKKVGVYISSQTLTENYRLVYDKILSQSFGYVRDYKILDEKKDEQFYEVKISTIVKGGEIKNDLLAINVLQERKGLPRVMIIIKEDLQLSGNEKSFGNQIFASQSTVEFVFTKEFNKKGFYVLDPSVVKQNKVRNQVIQALNGKKDAAKILGKMIDAELVVIGYVKTRELTNVADSNFLSVGAALSLKVVKTGTGEIIYADTSNASGAGLTSAVAKNNAMKRLAFSADRVISGILKKWQVELNNTRMIQITITNIKNFSDADYLKNTLIKVISGIEVMYNRDYEGGIAVLDAKIQGDTDQIALQIQKYQFKKFKVIVKGFNKNSIRLKIKY